MMLWYHRKMHRSVDQFFKFKAAALLATFMFVSLLVGCGDETGDALRDNADVEVLNTSCRVTGFPDTVTGNSLQTIQFNWIDVPESHQKQKFMVKVHFVNSEDTIIFQDDHILPDTFASYQREILIPLIPRSQKVTMLAGLYIPGSDVRYAIQNSQDISGNKVPVAQFTVTPPLHIDDLPEARISYGSGWYQKEFGESSNDSWRWISQTAECKLKGADRDLILYLHGFVPEDRLNGAVTLELLLDGEILGRYEDLTGEFIIKRVIENSQIQNGEFGELTIVADKSFMPAEIEQTDDTRSLSVMIKQFYFN